MQPLEGATVTFAPLLELTGSEELGGEKNIARMMLSGHGRSRRGVVMCSPVFIVQHWKEGKLSFCRACTKTNTCLHEIIKLCVTCDNSE